MLCVELMYDIVQFGSSPGLNALIENYVRHSHCRYQTVCVFERHGDVFVILREIAKHSKFFEIIKDHGMVLNPRFATALKIV